MVELLKSLIKKVIFSIHVARVVKWINSQNGKFTDLLGEVLRFHCSEDLFEYILANSMKEKLAKLNPFKDYFLKA